VGRWSRAGIFGQGGTVQRGRCDARIAGGARDRAPIFRESTAGSAEDGTTTNRRDLLRAVRSVFGSFESRRKVERARVAVRGTGGRGRTLSARKAGRARQVTSERSGKAKALRTRGPAWFEWRSTRVPP
jgi:hypothetical protein